MKTLKLTFLIAFLFAFSSFVNAQHITILHTNDIHSKIDGNGPRADYSPEVLNNDSVQGGFARLATLLKEQKALNPNGTLIVDAGDFLMGTLFNMNEPHTGFELAMMKKMGFQFTTIGNHEFDYGPNALADVINEAIKHGGIPQIISSNLKPVPNDTRDNKLTKLFENGMISPYKIITIKGIKIGIIGILGINAADVAPNKAPVIVEKQRKTAREMAKKLKKEKHIDLVICLSHSGVYPNKKSGFYGEDVKMARRAKYIDVIISGHTHVVTPRPIKVRNTLIVQTGSYLHNLGRLNLEVKNGRIASYHFELIPINDEIMGDKKINAEINAYEKILTKKYLTPLGLTYKKPIAETSFNLMKHNPKGYQHTDLGVFLDHAIKYYVDKYGGGTDVELLASGMVRDNILKGKTGAITVADMIRMLPLGRANKHLQGCPLAKIYITGHELKNLMEILLLSKSDDGYVFTSGIKVFYNPHKLMLTRVYKIEMNGKPIDLSKDNMKLYSVTAGTYLLSLVGKVKKFSHGLVRIVPKFKDGASMHDLSKAIIDFNRNKPGIQPGAEWLGVVRYLQHLKDTNGDGLPNIPLKYDHPLSNRIPGKKRK